MENKLFRNIFQREAGNLYVWSKTLESNNLDQEFDFVKEISKDNQIYAISSKSELSEGEEILKVFSKGIEDKIDGEDEHPEIKILEFE